MKAAHIPASSQSPITEAAASCLSSTGEIKKPFDANQLKAVVPEVRVPGIAVGRIATPRVPVVPAAEPLVAIGPTPFCVVI